MKVNINRLPSEFQNIAGVVEANLASLIKKYPRMEHQLSAVLKGSKSIDFQDESYIVRMLLKSGEILIAEVGLPSDKWRIVNVKVHWSA